MQVCYCKIMPDIGIAEMVGTAVGGAGTIAAAAEGIAMGQDVGDIAQGRPGRRTFLGRFISPKNNASAPSSAPHPFEPRKVAPVEPVGPPARFDAHLFKDTLPNMPATSEGGRERVAGVTPGETVEFSKEFVDGMRGFAESYVQRLINITNRTMDVDGRRVTVYDRMKDLQRQSGQSYAEDDFMLDLFAPADAQSGIRKLKNAAEINALITQHPETIQNLMVVAERYARDALAAAGIRAEMRGEGHRSNPADIPYSIDFPIDQGPINAAVRKVINWLDSPVNRGGRGNSDLRRYQAIAGTSVPGAAAGAFGGASVGGPVGALIGGTAGTALGPVVASAISRLTRSGVRLALVRDSEVLAQAQQEGEWMRANYLLGVDSQNPLMSTGLESAIQEAVQVVYLRAEYMKGLGVPPQQLDALSEQFLNVPGQRPEETGESMRNETMNRFRELGGRAAGLALMKQREIYRRAQEQAIVHRFEQLRAKSAAPTVNEVQRLTLAIAARRVGEGGEEGAILAARKREATEQRQRLTEDRTALEERGTTLTSYQQKLETARNAEQAVAGFISEITRTGVVAPPANFDEAINRLRETLNIAGTAATMVPDENGRLVPVPALVDRQIQVATQKAADIAAIPVPPGGPTDPAYITRVEGINRAYVTREQDVADLRNIVQGAIRRLQNLERTAANARQEALTSPETTNSLAALAEFDQAFARLQPAITAAAAGPGGLNYDTLVREVNNLGIWPVEDNSLPETRLLVRQALAQNRTLVSMQATIPNYAVLHASFQTITGQRISAEQLRALSLDELERRANQAGIPAGLARTTDLQQAKELTTYQLDYLQRAIQEESRIIQDQETILGRRIRSVNPENEIAQLNMVLEINNGRDQIYARANQAWMTPEQRTRLEDITPLNPGTARTEGYTEVEADSVLPRNALEILDILTGYQDDPDRGGKFQQIWTNLGGNSDAPGLLFRIFNDAFADRLAPPPIPPLAAPAPVPTITEFATRFRDSVQAHAITGASFGRGASRMINSFNAWSRTI